MIALCYAMPGEIASLVGDSTPIETVAGTSFYRIREDVIACCGGIGKVNAAMSAQLLIDRYHPDLMISVGVAGAMEDVPMDTIVLVDRFCQHDMDTTGIGDPVGFVSTVNRTDFPTADLARAKAAMEQTGHPFLTGSCATGDWFVTKGDRARWIHDTFRPLLCEMEGGAAAQVALRNGIPFMSIKSVSDYVFANQESYFDFPIAMAKLNPVVMDFLDALKP